MKSVSAVLTPDELMEILGRDLMKKKSPDYRGGIQVELMTVHENDSVESNIVQYRLTVNLTSPCSTHSA